MIKKYHSDKFNTSKFMEELLKKQQKLRLVGLVPHIKMGQAAERAINTVVNMENAILMQQITLWWNVIKPWTVDIFELNSL